MTSQSFCVACSGSFQSCLYSLQHLYVCHYYTGFTVNHQFCNLFFSFDFGEQIKNGHVSKSNLIKDYCDGENCKRHPLFSVGANGLQLLIYYDNLEICNPLGSKRKIHKLGLPIVCTCIYRLVI